VKEDDRIDLVGLSGLAPDVSVKGILRHADGTAETLELKHTLNAEQIGWFKAGSALNALAKGA
jgi:aconitate hydratase